MAGSLESKPSNYSEPRRLADDSAHLDDLQARNIDNADTWTPESLEYS